jgi:hypothetical protein
MPTDTMQPEVAAAASVSAGVVLTIAQIIAKARLHAFTDAEMPDLCAVVMTESGGKTDAVQPNGEGRGLVQIDLSQHPDVTEAEAFDPDFALAFARVMSRNPYGFGPPNWYGPTDHPEIAAKARADALAELAKEKPMEVWHPRAQRVIPADGHTGLTFDGALTKGVIHTTESKGLYSPDTSSYWGNPYWPNATIDTSGIYQHIPANLGSYALAHEYGSETNRADAIQCEVMWQAADGDWPDALLANLADWITWVSGPSVANVPLVFAEMFREGAVVASVDSPIRFGDSEWTNYHGWCGHSNIPSGNDHWDPGRLPVDRLNALLSPPQEDDLTPDQDAKLTKLDTFVNTWMQATADANRTNDQRFATINGTVDAIKADLDAIKAKLGA